MLGGVLILDVDVRVGTDVVKITLCGSFKEKFMNNIVVGKH